MLCFAKTRKQFGHFVYKFNMSVLRKSAYCTALTHSNSVKAVYAVFVCP